MKQRKILLPLMATIALTVSGYFGMKSFNHNGDAYSSMLRDNIEALTNDETGSQNSPGYVPDHYLEATIQALVVTCDQNGSLTIGSNILKGDYSKGASYPVVVEIKNCSGVQPGALCDQSQVGARIVG